MSKQVLEKIKYQLCFILSIYFPFCTRFQMKNFHHLQFSLRVILIKPSLPLLNIAKGTTDPSVELWFPKKKISKQILMKFHLHINLNQASAFQMNLYFKILTKASSGISTKNNLHNLNQAAERNRKVRCTMSLL